MNEKTSRDGPHKLVTLFARSINTGYYQLVLEVIKKSQKKK